MADTQETRKISYKKVGYLWKGVLKNESDETIFECCHLHRNRDQSSRSNGVSAKDCVKRAILSENLLYVEACRKAS